ncbi:unnamed protein product [Rotaria sp. Silwood1]|nr:unnamed protein product [Rotaria sp. Silwood1]
MELFSTNQSYLCSNIKYIHFDGINSISFDFIYHEIFYHNDKQRVCFPNLKSLNITQCLLSEPLIDTLSLLIQDQLDQLTLTFHQYIYITFDSQLELSLFLSNDDQWTNVKCVYDEDESYQHIFFASDFKRFQYYDILSNHSYAYNYSDLQQIKVYLNSPLYLFLKQFDRLCHSVSCITLYPGKIFFEYF